MVLIFYKHAQEKFDLPLSAQFGSAPQYNNPTEYKTVAPFAELYDQHVDALPVENVPEKPGMNDNDAQLVTPPPVDTLNVEFLTPSLETTPSPQIDNQVTQTYDNYVEPSGFEEVVQSEPATEESEDFISSIFRSAPDKALQDAIHTPPSAEINFPGQQNSDFMKNEERL